MHGYVTHFWQGRDLQKPVAWVWKFYCRRYHTFRFGGSARARAQLAFVCLCSFHLCLMPAIFRVSETRTTNPPTSLYLFFLLIFFALPATTMASTSSPTQCGSFSATYENVTSSSSLLILPFDAPPIRNLTNPNFDPVAKTWKYTLDKLPLKAGTQFVVTLDNGYGAPLSSPAWRASYQSPHIAFGPSGSISPNRCNRRKCISDPNCGQLV